MTTLYERLPRFLAEHGSLVLATLVETKGSAPRHVGAKMVVFPDGTVAGSLGGGALEKAVIEDALARLEARAPALLTYDLTEGGIGMKCGGKVRVYVEPVVPARRLVIFGAGHVGKALAAIAVRTGFAVEVVDDRADALDPASYAEGIRLLKTDAAFEEGYTPPGPADFAVVLTRDFDTDADITGRLAGACAYLGVMGSAAKWRHIRKNLAERGTPEDLVAKVHCPVGLDIGADTPEEIAVSILAELLSVRAKAR
ncbi:MAG: XdhC family protein [Acidobacteria bacterium]|nr:XdhC family protein [Acidobacteriota bacterium]